MFVRNEIINWALGGVWIRKNKNRKSDKERHLENQFVNINVCIFIKVYKAHIIERQILFCLCSTLANSNNLTEAKQTCIFKHSSFQ